MKREHVPKLVFAVVVIILVGVLARSEREDEPSDDPRESWPALYGLILTDGWTKLDPVERTQVCASVRSMTDSEFELLFAEVVGGDNDFDELMRQLELEPTADDYEMAILIARSEARSQCG